MNDTKTGVLVEIEESPRDALYDLVTPIPIGMEAFDWI